MIRLFEWPWLVAGAVAGALLVSILVQLGFRRRLTRLARMGARELVLRLVPATVLMRPSWRAFRLALAVLFASLALAGPRWGHERSVVRGEGIDMVLALDASLSMMATDDRPNRLERMKQEVRRLRAESRGDRIALLAFAGRSYILTPLTVDDGALELFLENLDPSIVGQAGSSLARTIIQGTELLQASRTSSDRAIVVMSDGEAFEEEREIIDAATKLGQAGIALVTVGFGTTEGSTIPIREGSQVVMKRDEFNNVVVTRYHPETLDAVARAAGGTFIDAAETDKAAKIRAALQSLRTSGRMMEGGRAQTPRYQLFLAPALALILLDLWRVERRRRRPRAAAAAAATAGALLLVVQGCTLPGSVAAGAAREYRGGRYARAAGLYRTAIAEGDRRPAMLYNLGTALVAADSLPPAVEPLERGTKSEDQELRFRSLFNLGLVHLKRGLAGEDGADSTQQALKAALEAYKRALLMRPRDLDAKWNYELALRKQEAGGGGGGGESESEQGGASAPEPAQSERPSGGLGQQQAEQLLNSAAREERGVQGRKQSQSKPRSPPGTKDW